MTHLTDNHHDDPFALLDLFRIKADSMTGSTAANYRKAIAALHTFLSILPADPPARIATTSFLASWLLHMSFRGLSRATSLHYLDIIAGLYRATVSDPDASAAFADIKAAARRIAPDSWNPSVNGDSFDRLTALTRRADRLKGQAALFTDILLTALINPALSLDDIVRLRIDEAPARLSPATAPIIARWSADPRRSYLFPLDQSRLTPRQLSALVESRITSILRQQGIPLAGSLASTILTYRIVAELRSGATPAIVASHIAEPPTSLPLLPLCRDAEADSVTADSDAPAALLLPAPAEWFAMRLRPHVTYGTLTARLAAIVESPEPLPIPELFYPCDEIARRTRSSFRREQRPILPDIVFFRSRMTDIHTLFYRIGDLAWCYTNGSTYAVIPRADMQLFQRTIGQFTPDYEVAPAGTLHLRPGDRIVVIGGDMIGHTGRIISHTAAPSTVYRILLHGPFNNIEWRLTDPRLIKRLSEPPQ